MIRMLFLLREEFPTHRVDVDVLFGQELLRRGHRIDFVMQAASADVQDGPVAWRGATVFVGPVRTGEGQIKRQLRGFRHDLGRLLRAGRRDYDAIQVRDKFVIAALASVYARLRGLKFFFWLSYPFPEDDVQRAAAGVSRADTVVRIRGRLTGWLLYRWILPRCDHAFVQSERMIADLAVCGADRRRLSAVPMGIARSEFDAAIGVTAPRSDGPIVIGYLGTLNSQRRLEVLVEMLALLVNEGRDVRLLLVGGGESPGDRPRIEQRAAEMGVTSRVEITGFLPREQAMARIRSATIGVSPFYATPVLLSASPTKLVEYMALGMPVIANDHPEQSLILKESRAGVCVPWSPRHFARAVSWLMRLDAAGRQMLGERGRAWVGANRTYDRIADAVEAQYERLLTPVERA